MTREEPKTGEVWKHFKGHYYWIKEIGHHSVTKEKMVVCVRIQDHYPKSHTIEPIALEPRISPLKIFMLEVDHEKYPDVEQKYRFEKVEE